MYMNSKTAKRIISALIIIVLCFTLLSFGTSAVSLDSKGSITLSALDKETKEPISGAAFRIYRFATAYTKGDAVYYTYTEDFSDNGMDMGNFSDAYLPIHLKAYADMNSLPYIEKTTDSTGKVTFDNLSCGAYLVVPAEIDEGYLNPNPFIVTVPMKDETQNKWIYNIDATPKIEADKDDTEEKTYISVKKLWKTTQAIPESITVSLVKDGEIAYSVILSEANNWYYRWDNLDKNHSWSVVETDVPEGYTVSYITSQMTVVITNTDDDYQDETTTAPEDTTKPDDTTNPDDTTRPDDTAKPTDTTKPTGTTQPTTKPEELIDTGQLNWPVPVFSIAGLLLFSIGYMMLNFGKKDEEAV
jgi:hypothetical protein